MGPDMDEYARAYGFTSWPFRVVVDAAFAHVWADRTQLKSDIERRLRRMRSVGHSTVQLMWADFGAGKSHTLRFIETQCRESPSRDLTPIYTEIPADLQGLLGLYQKFAAAIDTESLRNAGSTTQRTAGARDLARAVRLLNSNDQQGIDVATEWLYAEPGTPNLRTLRSFGIGARIDSDQRALDVLAALVATMHGNRNGAPCVWLIDEFQRIADIQPKKRDALAKGLVSLFNACPSGLHMVLSFSVAQQSTVDALLPADLLSRAATFPLLALPFLDHDDARVFLTDLFARFSADPQANPHFPLTSESIDLVIYTATEASNGRLTPRILMEAIGGALAELYEASPTAPVLPVSSTALDPALREWAQQRGRRT